MYILVHVRIAVYIAKYVFFIKLMDVTIKLQLASKDKLSSNYTNGCGNFVS